jgi:hypothetical protein
VVTTLLCPRRSETTFGFSPPASKSVAMVWRLCRARHKRHYADFRIMPRERAKAALGALEAYSESA